MPSRKHPQHRRRGRHLRPARLQLRSPESLEPRLAPGAMLVNLPNVVFAPIDSLHSASFISSSATDVGRGKQLPATASSTPTGNTGRAAVAQSLNESLLHPASNSTAHQHTIKSALPRKSQSM